MGKVVIFTFANGLESGSAYVPKFAFVNDVTEPLPTFRVSLVDVGGWFDGFETGVAAVQVAGVMDTHKPLKITPKYPPCAISLPNTAV